MSFLADLLAKVKQPQTARDVPPNLKNIVQASAKKSAGMRRIILLSSLLIVAVLAGVYLVYLSKSLSEKPDGDIGMPRQKRTGAAEQAQVEEARKPDKDNPRVAATETQPPPAPALEKEAKAGPSEKKDKASASSLPSAQRKRSVKGGDILPALEQVIVKESPALKAGPADESARDTYLYKARESEMKGDYRGALGNYQKVLELDRNNFTAMNNMAYLYLKMGLTEEAVTYSTMALQANGNYVPALINLGIASAMSGNVPDAEKYFNRALRIDSNSHDALFNLALLYEKLTDYPKATGYFSKLAGSGSASGLVGLARVYEKRGDAVEALKIYRTAYAGPSLDDKTRAEVKQRIVVLSGKMQGMGN
ncbi:MAG: tetratricopeptide repeat protein [Nitrospirae bacterium]|nr:tetratricopeptide repeat protein [Nitrospirota bacterium]